MHHLSVAENLSDRIAVMQLDRVVESADAATRYANPQHPYTEALLRRSRRPNQDVAPHAASRRARCHTRSPAHRLSFPPLPHLQTAALRDRAASYEVQRQWLHGRLPCPQPSTPLWAGAAVAPPRRTWLQPHPGQH